MEKERKIITRKQLLVVIAKWIKKIVKTEKYGEITIDFRVGKNDLVTSFQVGHKWYYVDNSINPVDIITDALNETRYKGIVYRNGMFVFVRVYGKPADSFKKFSRMLYRVSGVMLKWDDVKTRYVYDKQQSDKYLCYDNIACDDACRFIKYTRASKNKVKVDIQYDCGEVFRRVLNLSIVSPSGKEKNSRSIFV
jgi:hypothetical protein